MKRCLSQANKAFEVLIQYVGANYLNFSVPQLLFCVGGYVFDACQTGTLYQQ